jgi:AP-2 complex subunit alpha
MTGYDQFAALHQHFAGSSPKTRCILLTTYAKLVNLYPEQVKDLIGDVYTKFSSSSHLELQQRAIEYNALGSVSAATIEAVLNTMPPFELEKKENLLMAIENTESVTADRPAWAVEQTEKNASRAAYQEARKPTSKTEEAPKQEHHHVHVAPVQAITKTVDLLSLDDSDNGFESTFGGASASMGGGSGLSASQIESMQELCKAACLVRGLNTKNSLVNTDLVNVSVAHDYRTHQGRLALTVFNKSGHDIQGLAISFTANDALIMKQQGLSSSLAAGGESVAQIAADCMKPFSESPTIELAFTCKGVHHEYQISLPISVCSFCEPLPMDKATYMARWKAITAEGTENQLVFSARKTVNGDLLNFIKTNLFVNSKIGIAEGLDNDRTATGSCTFLTGTAGADGKRIAVGTLMRLEGDPANNKFRITVRATHPTVSLGLKNFLVHQLS